ncbi:hypothetical protein [Corallococcus sp. AB038B]|uniref:hypothetical protein n=1 Tax=Corallococcus sp. AB038B TaxID=2316718 RepID=UPI000EBA32A2|nr:hypothetical protein [Corallococcus sp. AB038B]RKH96065.1 hypothetical protein D7Y04_30530 [Corallococcus sp. AB038B]
MRQSRTTSFLGWVVMTCLLALHAAAGPASDQIKVERRGELLSLSWRDAEDQLNGVLTPAVPRPGESLRLTLSVGNLQGPPFQGAVTVAFSREGVPGQVTRTLTRDAVGWSTEFVPDEAGTWDVDVRFLTTRPKSAHARFTVSEPPVPPMVWRVLMAIAGGLLLARVLYAVTRRGVTPEHPIPPLPQAPPEAAPVESGAEAPEPGAAAPVEPAAPPADPPADR